MSSRAAAAHGATKEWLTLVGIGEDGIDGIGLAAQRAIESAELVFGGARHLALAAPLIRGETWPWPVPFDTAMTAVLAARGRTVCVLASGDPMQFGVGGTLARLVPANEMRTIPGPCAFSLAAARLGWPLQDCETVSLHGRAIERLRPLLHPGRRVIALTSDGASPSAIAALLTADGFGASRMHVLEALGGADEEVNEARAEAVGDRRFASLNTVAIEVVAGDGARILPLGGGLADELFEHDGQITKAPMRALTLAALAPRRGELLWDIGAGSGSVSIGWMLAHPSLAAVAIETVPERAARIRRNAFSCGVPDLRIVEGSAPGALPGLPQPDAIFVGGGGSDAALIDAATTTLRPGGRLVANGVTLETEAQLLALHARLGGELLRVSLARAAPVGGMSGWRPAMPVTQWRWVKP